MVTSPLVPSPLRTCFSRSDLRRTLEIPDPSISLLLNFCKGQKRSQVKPCPAWTTSVGCRAVYCCGVTSLIQGSGTKESRQIQKKSNMLVLLSKLGLIGLGMGAGPGAGRIKAAMGKQVLTQIYFPFCSTRALRGPGKC